jgi:hypothetical protein
MASLTRLEPGAPSLRTANLARLERLAAVLEQRGMEASPVAPECRVPRLVVCHPAGQSEEIYAWRCRDGAWWYWWPWAERIATDGEAEQAAARIEQQLTRSPEA